MSYSFLINDKPSVNRQCKLNDNESSTLETNFIKGVRGTLLYGRKFIESVTVLEFWTQSPEKCITSELLVLFAQEPFTKELHLDIVGELPHKATQYSKFSRNEGLNVPIWATRGSSIAL